MKSFFTINKCFIAACFLFSLGCAHTIEKIDLDRFLENQEAYRGKEVVFTAGLSDVLARYRLYLDKRVEITAPCSMYSSLGFWTWYFMLETGEQKLRCYTHHYRLRADIRAENMLLEARHESAAITVEGVVRHDGLDLEKIMYDGRLVLTNFKMYPLYPGYWCW